jgi:hypothetical protein
MVSSAWCIPSDVENLLIGQFVRGSSIASEVVGVGERL